MTVNKFLRRRRGINVVPPLLQLILSLPQVEACAVSLYEGSRLLAFVVAFTPAEQTAEHRGDPRSAAKHHQEETGGADGDLSRLILSRLSQVLPAHSVPDVLVLVPSLCLTPHGEHQTQGRA